MAAKSGSASAAIIVGASPRRLSTGPGQLMGRFVEARRWENEKVEGRLKAKALNRMTRLGMPQTSKVAV